MSSESWAQDYEAYFEGREDGFKWLVQASLAEIVEVADERSRYHVTYQAMGVEKYSHDEDFPDVLDSPVAEVIQKVLGLDGRPKNQIDNVAYEAGFHDLVLQVMSALSNWVEIEGLDLEDGEECPHCGSTEGDVLPFSQHQGPRRKLGLSYFHAGKCRDQSDSFKLAR